MDKMTEKQKDLIIKLSSEKNLEKGILFDIEARTGHDLTSDNFENLTKYEASMLINLLIKAPKQEWVDEKNKKMEEAKNKYEQLVLWAKNQGLNVRKRMKKTTILSTIKAAGLIVPAELI